MTRSQQPALTLFAVGMIGLGILALVFGDFALVWQPVAPWIPGRTVLAYASGLIMLFGGVGLLLRAMGAGGPYLGRVSLTRVALRWRRKNGGDGWPSEIWKLVRIRG